MSVSEEQHYQDALRSSRGVLEFCEVTAELRLADQGNPWSKKPSGPVLEVLVDGKTVGFLTAAMTARYRPFFDAAAASRRALVSKASIGPGSGSNGRDIEITLNAIPRPADQLNIRGLRVATTPGYIVTRRSGTAHVIRSETAGGWLTDCGQSLTTTRAEIILTTKPWVGRVRADGTVLPDESPMWCENCRPDRTDIIDGGRFGAQTTINRDNRFSTAMTAKAVSDGLADYLDFDVAGESHRPDYPDTLLRFAEVLRGLPPGDYLAVVLRRDPSNAYDGNAIEIHVPGEHGHVGFVPAALARHIAPVLDGGGQLRASAVEVRIHPDSPDKPGLTVRLSKARSS